MKLFVYGSLKRGFFNHGRFGFSDVAKFIGPAVARDRALLQLRNLPYPHAVEEPEQEVVGEVYELDDEYALRNISRMERGAGYYAKETMVECGESIFPATMYVADEYLIGELPREGMMREWTKEMEEAA